MKHTPETRRILVIDRQDHWRQDSAQALEAKGFSVHALDDYDYSPSRDLSGETPDLIVLGCASIGPEEQAFIVHLLESGQNLLVLCSSLPSQTMRTLFLAGANDVANKTYDPAHLVSAVEQALTSLSPRDSYRAVEQGGVS